jgi:thiol:disulfide interchange protein
MAYVEYAAFAAAIAIPIFLLWFFGRQAWSLHVLAVAVVLAIGFAPPTPVLNAMNGGTPVGTFIYGFVVALLFIWGVGGLFAKKRHSNSSAASAS